LPGAHRERDGILAELSESLMRLGELPEAVEIAQGVLGRPHDPEVDMQLRLGLIDALSVLFRADDLIEQTDLALSESPDLAPAAQAFFLAQSSFGQTFSGNPMGAESAACRALELAQRAGDPAMLTWSLTTLSVAMQMQGCFDEAVRVTSRAVSEALAAPDEQARLRGPFFMHGMSLCAADRLEEAEVAYRRAAAECDELESWWLLPDIQLMSTEIRFLRGDWEELTVELEGGLQFARAHGNLITLPRFHAYSALVASARGDVKSGELALAPFVAKLDDEQPEFGTEFVFYAAATLNEVAGQPLEALELLRRFWQRAAQYDLRYGYRFIAPALVRLALSLDAPEMALDATEGAERAAALSGDVPSIQSAALRCRG
jgi:ATP/maltotriose-dependent transcriptional regulator MalT